MQGVVRQQMVWLAGQLSLCEGNDVKLVQESESLVLCCREGICEAASIPEDCAYICKAAAGNFLVGGGGGWACCALRRCRDLGAAAIEAE